MGTNPWFNFTQLKFKNWPTQNHKKLETCYMLKLAKRKALARMKNIPMHVPLKFIINPHNIDVCWFTNLEWQCKMEMCINSKIYGHTSQWPYPNELWDNFIACSWCNLKSKRSICPLLNLVWSQWIFQQASKFSESLSFKMPLDPTSTTTEMLGYN
jgi:hypothetical protein